jgi:hypothetical protein
MLRKHRKKKLQRRCPENQPFLRQHTALCTKNKLLSDCIFQALSKPVEFLQDCLLSEKVLTEFSAGNETHHHAMKCMMMKNNLSEKEKLLSL